MTKYIYHSKDLRCSIKYDKVCNDYTLQIQKKVLIFWFDVFDWMTVEEGFWGECERFPILRNSYQYGNKSEAYMTGTLDIPKRVQQFFKQYFEHNLIRENAKKRLHSL